MRILATILALLLFVSTASAKPKVADKKFWFLAAATFGSAIADEEITQYKIGTGKYRESNPILGQSRARAYPILLATATASVLASYEYKKDGSKRWWVPATVTYEIHAFAIGYNLRLK